MLKEILLLQTFSYTGGGEFGNIIDSLAQLGFFSYVLPFLLVFAIIYGILTKVKLFGDKNAINAVIALAIGLIALQFEAVPMFFSDIFPRLGIGLAVILVLLILIGLFMPNQPWIGYVLFAVSALIFITILFQSIGASSGVFLWLENNWTMLIALAFVILVFVVAVIGKPSKPQPPASSVFPILYPQPPKP